jgi:hypothetical protein
MEVCIHHYYPIPEPFITAKETADPLADPYHYLHPWSPSHHFCLCHLMQEGSEMRNNSGIAMGVYLFIFLPKSCSTELYP